MSTVPWLEYQTFIQSLVWPVIVAEIVVSSFLLDCHASALVVVNLHIQEQASSIEPSDSSFPPFSEFDWFDIVDSVQRFDLLAFEIQVDMIESNLWCSLLAVFCILSYRDSPSPSHMSPHWFLGVLEMLYWRSSWMIWSSSCILLWLHASLLLGRCHLGTSWHNLDIWKDLSTCRSWKTFFFLCNFTLVNHCQSRCDHLISWTVFAFSAWCC